MYKNILIIFKNFPLGFMNHLYPLSSCNSNFPHIYYAMSNYHFLPRRNTANRNIFNFLERFYKISERNYILLTSNQIWETQLSMHIIISFVCNKTTCAHKHSPTHCHAKKPRAYFCHVNKLQIRITIPN